MLVVGFFGGRSDNLLVLGDSVFSTSIALQFILVVPEYSDAAYSRLQSKGCTDACSIPVCCLLLSFASELWLKCVCFSHVLDIRMPQQF